MTITVNGFDITDEMITAELPRHAESGNPAHSAACELVFRRLLLQTAATRGLQGESDDDLINALLTEDIIVTPPDSAACQAFYDKHPEYFRSGEYAEARHILFQASNEAEAATLNLQAEAVLSSLRNDINQFDVLARAHSKCPSAAQGGDLGQLKRGDTVPEFDDVLFRLQPGELLDEPLTTRFGVHLIQVTGREHGSVVPFADAAQKIGHFLAGESHREAVQSYLHTLLASAKIEGIDIMGGAAH